MDKLVVNAVAPWEGYLHWKGNIKEGVSKTGNEYGFADFVLKYTDTRMQDAYIMFSISDPEKVKMLKNLRKGTPLRVSWFPGCREDSQNDRWYGSLRAWGISVIEEVATNGQKKAAERTATETPQRNNNEAWKNPLQEPDYSDAPSDGSDLPF